MKKYLLIIVCMAAIVHGAGAQEFIPSASDYARLYVGAVEAQYQKWLWHDCPYYKDNTDTYTGRVSYYGVVYDNVELRYDQFNKRLVVLTPGGKFFCVPEQEHVDWFEMDGHRYVHDPEDSLRYAYMLCDGASNGIRLYRSEWKIYDGERVFGRNNYQKILSTKHHFALVTPDGAIHHVKRASDVIKIFPEQKKQIKQFVRRNHLSFGKRERERSLARLVEAIGGGYSRNVEGGMWNENSETPSLRANISPSSSLLPPSSSPNISPSSFLFPPSSSPNISHSTFHIPPSTFLLPPSSNIPDSTLIPGIPVLDIDTLSMAGSANTKTYIVPGVKKARASIADDQELAEIVVVGGRQSAVNSMMMGSEKFKPQVLKNIPSAFGESDIMKIVLTLPGVTTVGEASSGYNVRGGATDQNLILFNGGTVYNPSHLFGLFTSFNSDAVEDVELFKSSIPVEYGGRISSVLKVSSKEANMQKLTGSASIGVLTSKVNLEIPIVKDHLIVTGY